MITSLFSTCRRFVDYIDQVFTKTLNLDNVEYQGKGLARQYRQTRIKIASEQAKKLTQDEAFVRTMAKFENGFALILKQLTEAVTSLSTTQEGSHNLANLLLQLDYNDYYKNYFEKNQSLSLSSSSSASLSSAYLSSRSSSKLNLSKGSTNPQTVLVDKTNVEKK